MKKMFCVLLGSAFLAGLSLTSYAMEEKEQGSMHGMKMEEKAYSKQVSTEGVKVIFYIETMEAHKKAMERMKKKTGKMEMMKMDPNATHHISVSFMDEKTEEMITDVKGKVKVIDPKDKAQENMLMWMASMKHYGACFDLSEKGKYQVLVLFKIDDKKRKAGFQYERK